MNLSTTLERGGGVDIFFQVKGSEVIISDKKKDRRSNNEARGLGPNKRASLFAGGGGGKKSLSRHDLEDTHTQKKR